MTRPMVMGFHDEYHSLDLEPGEQGILVLMPQQLFRVDRLYFETEGLLIVEVKVGNRPQGISGAPSSYYREVDADGLKGRLFRFDTAEVGNTITFELRNLNPRKVTVEGCVEGVTA